MHSKKLYTNCLLVRNHWRKRNSILDVFQIINTTILYFQRFIQLTRNEIKINQTTKPQVTRMTATHDLSLSKNCGSIWKTLGIFTLCRVLNAAVGRWLNTKRLFSPPLATNTFRSSAEVTSVSVLATTFNVKYSPSK